MLRDFDIKTMMPMQGYCIIDGSNKLLNHILKLKIGQPEYLDSPIGHCSYYTETECDFRWSINECEPIFKSIIDQSPILSHWNVESFRLLFEFFRHRGLAGIISNYAYHLLPKSVLVISEWGPERKITGWDNVYLEHLRANAIQNNCLILETMTSWNYSAVQKAQVVILTDRFFEEATMPVSYEKFGTRFREWYYQRPERLKQNQGIVLIDQGTQNWDMYLLDCNLFLK